MWATQRAQDLVSSFAVNTPGLIATNSDPQGNPSNFSPKVLPRFFLPIP
jgi:hypothetical protein